ncbi:MAG: ABC transporter substrate-binding protein [Deltaproteobacteria bacterium]|nr:ABC transporter substrate-binding protein [Deltaproteobacteria bacterium]
MPIRVGQSSITDVQVASIVTQQAGIFRKYGLTAELILLQGGPQTVQALISGSLHFVDVAGPALISSQLAGADVVPLLYQITGLTHSLFVKPDIQAAKDLKGKKVGVVRIGGLAEYIARYMLTEKLGLKPAEVQLIQVGGQAERVAALESGAIHATVFSPPQSTRVKKLGFKELADASELEYPTGVIGTTRQIFTARPELVERVMKSYLEGIAYFWLHKDKTVPMLQRQFRLSERLEAEEMYDKLAKVVPKRPRPPYKGIKMVLESLKDRNPRAATMDAATFVDSTLVKRLEAQGFIDRLYH